MAFAPPINLLASRPSWPAQREIFPFRVPHAARRILWKRRSRGYRTAATLFWLVARLATDTTAAALRRWANRSIRVCPIFRSAQTQNLTDGEIHYIIENGVELTGMPAWDNPHQAQGDDSWKLVLFIRSLAR